jgi:flagellin-like hook-associated protein FlgL
MLQIRADFTTNLINTLKGGASDLVNADLNEESANLLSLQTRQQLGTISLSIAQRSEQSILRLF